MTAFAPMIKYTENKKGRRKPTFFIWWTNRDSNPGPTGYEPVALTN